VTDVTGFGLMGHGRELALGSGVTIEIETERFYASTVRSTPSL
jgi:selenide,water dikinase